MFAYYCYAATNLSDLPNAIVGPKGAPTRQEALLAVVSAFIGRWVNGDFLDEICSQLLDGELDLSNEDLKSALLLAGAGSASDPTSTLLDYCSKAGEDDLAKLLDLYVETESDDELSVHYGVESLTA